MTDRNVQTVIGLLPVAQAAAIEVERKAVEIATAAEGVRLEIRTEAGEVV